MLLYAHLSQLVEEVASKAICSRFESEGGYQRAFTAVGQRGGLINRWSLVQVQEGPPIYARLAQQGEHLPYKQRVTGSIPVVCTNHRHLQQNINLYCLEKQKVAGSSPACPTTWGGSSVGRAFVVKKGV